MTLNPERCYGQYHVRWVVHFYIVMLSILMLNVIIKSVMAPLKGFLTLINQNFIIYQCRTLNMIISIAS
jgi:hypothetical protein